MRAALLHGKLLQPDREACQLPSVGFVTEPLRALRALESVWINSKSVDTMRSAEAAAPAHKGLCWLEVLPAGKLPLSDMRNSKALCCSVGMLQWHCLQSVT